MEDAAGGAVVGTSREHDGQGRPATQDSTPRARRHTQARAPTRSGEARLCSKRRRLRLLTRRGNLVRLPALPSASTVDARPDVEQVPEQGHDRATGLQNKNACRKGARAARAIAAAQLYAPGARRSAPSAASGGSGGCGARAYAPKSGNERGEGAGRRCGGLLPHRPCQRSRGRRAQSPPRSDPRTVTDSPRTGSWAASRGCRRTLPPRCNYRL